MSNTELNVTSAPTSLAQQYGNPVSALTGFTEYLVKLATWKDPKVPYSLSKISLAVKEQINSITPSTEVEWKTPAIIPVPGTEGQIPPSGSPVAQDVIFKIPA